MKKYTIVHEHEFGNTVYTFISDRVEDIWDYEIDMTEEDYAGSGTEKICLALGIDFEPWKNEFLNLNIVEQDDVINLDTLL